MPSACRRDECRRALVCMIRFPMDDRGPHASRPPIHSDRSQRRAGPSRFVPAPPSPRPGFRSETRRCRVPITPLCGGPLRFQSANTRPRANAFATTEKLACNLRTGRYRRNPPSNCGSERFSPASATGNESLAERKSCEGRGESTRSHPARAGHWRQSDRKNNRGKGRHANPAWVHETTILSVLFATAHPRPAVRFLRPGWSKITSGP